MVASLDKQMAKAFERLTADEQYSFALAEEADSSYPNMGGEWQEKQWQDMMDRGAARVAKYFKVSPQHVLNAWQEWTHSCFPR